MVHHTLRNSNTSYSHTGSFSKISANLYLQRKFGQFFLDVYVPITLFVVVSWGSFWIEITAAPARVTLGVTVMLTTVTTARSAREKLPQVSYMHALDIWIVVAVFFIFASTIEYVAVNYIYFREKRHLLKKNKRMKSQRRHKMAKQFNDSISDCDDESSSKSNQKQNGHLNNDLTINSSEIYIPHLNYKTHDYQSKQNTLKEAFTFIGKKLFNVFKRQHCSNTSKFRSIEGCEEIAYEIDRKCRFIFPISYIMFNITYWLFLIVYPKEIGYDF